MTTVASAGDTGLDDEGTGLVEALADLRPRLRHDVVFADAGDGVYLRDSERSFFIKGRVAYRWLSILAPHLTGDHTVAELCAGLSDDRREMVRGLVESLLDRGFVRGVSEQDRTVLASPLLERFAAQVGYVEHYADDAVARFTRFATARVLLAGADETAAAVGVGLLRNGLRQLDLLSGLDLGAEVGLLAEDGYEVRVRRVTGAREELDLPGYDLVIIVADGADGGGQPVAAGAGLHHAVELVDAVRAAGSCALPVVVFGSRALLGPMTRSEQAPCLLCGLLRLGGNLPASEAVDLWRAVGFAGPLGQMPEVPAQTARMLGATVAFDVFRELTGCITAETDRAMVIQDLGSWESVREVLLPHPLCPSCSVPSEEDGTPASAGAGPVVTRDDTADGRPEQDDPVADEVAAEFEQRVQNVLVSRHLGIATEFADGTFNQAPVKVARLRLGPAGRLGTRAREISAFDVQTLAAARTRLLRSALTTYVDQIADPRAATTDDGTERVAPSTLQTFSGFGPEPATARWVPGRSYRSGRPVLVPFDAAYPFGPQAAARRFEATSAGTGCGRTLDEATHEGIRSALAYQAVRDALRGRAVVTRVSADSAGDCASVTFLRRTVTLLEREVDVLLIGDGQPVPVFLAVERVTGTVAPAWAVAAGWSVDDALTRALCDVVGRLQLRAESGDDQVDLGDPLLADFDPRGLSVSAGEPDRAGMSGLGAADAEARTRVLTRFLDVRGQDAVVVRTTTPDLRAVGSVETVRVLLTEVSADPAL